MGSALLIPLKAKYRRGHKGRFNGGEKPAPRKHRDKIGYEKHVKQYGVPPEVMLYVDGLTGKGKLVVKRV